MEHSELFLLLPKYEDVEEQPEYIKSTNIMTEDEILKVEYYEIKPMTPEDAKLKLEERPSQMFLTFVNQENGKVNVIHRLKDGKNFGLIEPEA